MRPTLLDPLFASITSLDGIGAKLAKLFSTLLGRSDGRDDPVIRDLLFHLPHAVIDRRSRPGVAFAPQGSIVTLEITVDRHQAPPRGRPNIPYRVYAFDDTGEIALTFFRGQANWLEKSLPTGEQVVVSGKMDWFNGRPSMVHPDHVCLAREADKLPALEPIYPLTAGLSGKIVTRAINGALARVPAMPEWIEHHLQTKQNFPTFGTSLDRLHHPGDELDAELNSAAWRRLAYDEFLANQLALMLVRSNTVTQGGVARPGTGVLRQQLLDALPFSLTNSQLNAGAEIAADLGAPKRMVRLLQGDVGAGKTAVALLGMVQVIESKGQAALMAPTEVLARQHWRTIAPLAAQLGLTCEVLTARETGAARRQVLGALEAGGIDIVVGTHALFQDAVNFANLGLVVVDEQHRFGVHQRLALTAKGNAPDMLVMSATPIPRTLVLAAFGDMDVSNLTDKPAGRKPVRTVALPLERLDQTVKRLAEAVARGEKAYWICPLVEDSELSDLTSAEQRFENIAPVFPDQIGLVHGRMSGAEKDAAMRAFRDGETKVLVATTVVEVGVDVPDATIMIIEHAERFGLSQIHQLRGRVGRSELPSSCLLLHANPLGDVARQRLDVLCQSQDGFEIAEQDLKLRGEGELLGTRQSGTPGFRVARLAEHGDLLSVARADAKLIMETDADLHSERGRALRVLLYLFGRDEAVRLLKSG